MICFSLFCNIFFPTELISPLGYFLSPTLFCSLEVPCIRFKKGHPVYWPFLSILNSPSIFPSTPYECPNAYKTRSQTHSPSPRSLMSTQTAKAGSRTKGRWRDWSAAMAVMPLREKLNKTQRKKTPVYQQRHKTPSIMFSYKFMQHGDISLWIKQSQDPQQAPLKMHDVIFLQHWCIIANPGLPR